MNILTVPAPTFADMSWHKTPFFMVSNNPNDYRPCNNPTVRARRKSLREMRHGRSTTHRYTDLSNGLNNVLMPVVIGPVVTEVGA